MRLIRLAKETDFDGWRTAARSLRLAGVLPRKVAWTVNGSEIDMAFPEARPPGDAPGMRKGAFTVPKAFADLAVDVVLHRSPDRFNLLYRLLFRLAQNPRLMEDAADSDVARARDFAGAVRAASARMEAEVRLRLIEDAPRPVHVGWHAPAHRVAERAALALTARYAQICFSVLTPEASLHWDTRTLTVGAGARLGDSPSDEAVEAHWRKRCMALFPATPAPPAISSRDLKAALRGSRDGPYERGAPASHAEIVAGVDTCRRCGLWREASRGVAGEGPARAALMLVGEQPSDPDDLAGRPFTGSAGALLDQALTAAGLTRSAVFLTNAVRHFKHERRGQRRLHRSPGPGEVDACRWWLDAERRLVQPKVVVALGATAALSVFGKALPVLSSRGQPRPLSGRTQGLVTFHPAFILRLPDDRARRETFGALVQDLKLAGELCGVTPTSPKESQPPRPRGEGAGGASSMLAR